ncbi:hypothetical protein TELCIR_15068 [Teladorsagia circumcincta]|uniref:WAP domain-containing protein n=1 Tax=Teladorsagia circumcincta TaxID=45464 RepID=A0A2G9TZ72_TELCI|nr:hypothetical protein TELCIR_15068 [Teladorsagia circumcincta]
MTTGEWSTPRPAIFTLIVLLDMCSSEDLRSASKFAFGRSIIDTPDNCFTGVASRIERECGRVKNCCSAVSRCISITTTSPTAASLADMKTRMQQRAADCDRGAPISKSQLPQCTIPPIPAGSSQPQYVAPMPSVNNHNGGAASDVAEAPHDAVENEQENRLAVV